MALAVDLGQQPLYTIDQSNAPSGRQCSAFTRSKRNLGRRRRQRHDFKYRRRRHRLKHGHRGHQRRKCNGQQQRRRHLGRLPIVLRHRRRLIHHGPGRHTANVGLLNGTTINFNNTAAPGSSPLHRRPSTSTCRLLRSSQACPTATRFPSPVRHPRRWPETS